MQTGTARADLGVVGPRDDPLRIVAQARDPAHHASGSKSRLRALGVAGQNASVRKLAGRGGSHGAKCARCARRRRPPPQHAGRQRYHTQAAVSSCGRSSPRGASMPRLCRSRGDGLLRHCRIRAHRISGLMPSTRAKAKATPRRQIRDSSEPTAHGVRASPVSGAHRPCFGCVRLRGSCRRHVRPAFPTIADPAGRAVSARRTAGCRRACACRTGQGARSASSSSRTGRAPAATSVSTRSRSPPPMATRSSSARSPRMPSTRGCSPSLPYDPLKDFAPITLVAHVPNVLVMTPERAQQLHIAALRDLVAYARANPGKLELRLRRQRQRRPHGRRAAEVAGPHISAVHIPYAGAAPAQLGLLAGQTDFMFDNLASALHAGQSRQAARLRGDDPPRRSASMPDVPTMAESGLPRFRRVDLVRRVRAGRHAAAT